MIIDARQLDDATELACDLCIVGSGPAGISLALEFLGTGIEVIVLEAGGREESPESQEFYAGENVGLDYDVAGTRYRVFGGTSRHWGGYTSPLDADDFTVHDAIPLSGWPIDLETVAPYLPRAARLLAFDEQDFDPEYWAGQGHPLLRFPAGTVQNKIWRFNRLDFAVAYGEQLAAAPNIRVLLNAPVVRIATDPARTHVESLTARPTPDTSLTVAARRHVLACGALETPRLLLTAGPDHTPLVDNPNVGRFFMEHFHLTWSIDLALFTEAAASELYRQCGIIDDCCEVRAFFQVDPARRRELGLTNVALKVHHEAEPHPVARAAGELAARLHGREDRYRPGSVSVMAEQVPNPSSRITMTEARDALGVPRLRLDWRATTLDNRSVLRSVETLAEALGAGGLGRLRPNHEIRALDRTTDFDGHAHGGAHHMGTTRMSGSAHDGVVDSHCRVHGVDNLYIAGSSVFATSGSANPTLTLMALAIRLADHLAPDLRG